MHETCQAWLLIAPKTFARCGRPATGVHDYSCGHGHAVRAGSCPAHAPEPGSAGCPACFAAGHDCTMTAREAVPGA